MATDVERLIVSLEARTKAFENALAKANGTANRQARAIEKRFTELNRNVSTNFLGLVKTLAGGIAGSVIARQFVQLSESATRINNSLRVAGVSGEELDRVYKSLEKSALANGAPVETLATLYGRAAQAQKELGVTSEELLRFTNNVAVALRVAGTDAQTASGALLQLGQALGSGKVQAEEFNSILEGAPTIAQAVAAGLKEAGGSVSRLKTLIVDGKISSEAFFRAFEAGSVTLEQKATKATFTLAQASTNLVTALTGVVRQFNDSTGASERFARGLDNAAKSISRFDVDGIIQKIKDADENFRNYLSTIELFDKLNKLTGTTDADGNVINIDKQRAEDDVKALEREVELLQQRIQLNTTLEMDNTEALARLAEVQAKLAEVRATADAMPDFVEGYRVGPNGIEPITGTTNGQMGGSSIRGGARRRPVKPVSVDDFDPPPGSSSGSKKKRQNDYERESKQIQERTALLQAQTSAQAAMNPLVDDYGFAVEKAAAKQELLAAAQQAGKKITPELSAEIDNLATSYALAVQESGRLSEKQDEIRQRAEDAMSTAKDVTRGLIDGLVEGASAADILTDSLKRIGDALIDDVLDSLFKVNNASGGGGFLSGLLGLFGGGGTGTGLNYFPPAPGRLFAKGGVANQPSIFGEAGPEAAVPLPDGRRIPVDLRGAASGAVSVSMPISIDATGADAAGLARLQKSLDTLRAEIPGRVVEGVKNAQLRRTI